MLGIETGRVRDLLEESIGPIARLLNGETVPHKIDWFTLQDARLHLLPDKEESFEMAVASQVSPTGSLLAGKFGMGLLSLGATSIAGFNALASNWKIAEEAAAKHDQTVNRKGWWLGRPDAHRRNARTGTQGHRMGLSSLGRLLPPRRDAAAHAAQPGDAAPGELEMAD
jgi:limonene 1,2-monooxygenase